MTIPQVCRAVVLVIVLLPGAGTAHAQSDAVFFSAGFNGTPQGVLAGQPLAPAEHAGLRFVASDHSRAVQLAAGSRASYALGNTFPGDAGGFEIRFRPDFPQTADAPARDVLTLAGRGGSTAVLSFQPVGLRWLLTVSGKGWRKELTLWHGRVQASQWNHMLFTWNRSEQAFAIYHNGKRVETVAYDNRFGTPSRLELGGTLDAGISVDEVAVYRRAFTHQQAAFLAASFEGEGQRFAALARQLEADDRALAARRELLAQLKGKVGRVYHNRGAKLPRTVYPEGVESAGIRPEDIGKVDLGQFSVLHFPQGPRFQIEPEQYRHIVDFVKNGGGYVGCCQGAFFAEQLQLVDIRCFAMDVWGLYNIALKKPPHFVKAGRQGTIRMHFGNGPVMLAGEQCEVLGTYALGFPAGEPAAIVTGRCGKGRVVLFGTHPLGEKVSYKGTRAWFDGKLLETDRMFVNALLYAAGVVDREGKPQQAESEQDNE